MKKHQKIIATTSILIGLALIGYSLWQNGEKEEAKPTGDNGSEVVWEESTGHKETPPEEQRLGVSIIGTHDLSQNSFTNYHPMGWEDTPNEAHRFILVSADETITEEKTNILQKWIAEKKVVVFYGTDVQPEEVKSKLGLEGEVIDVETTTTLAFPYLLYGFGYSEVHGKPIPIFMGSNTANQLAEKIGTFLYKNASF